mgnify:CR=1 FL=1
MIISNQLEEHTRYIHKTHCPLLYSKIGPTHASITRKKHQRSKELLLTWAYTTNFRGSWKTGRRGSCNTGRKYTTKLTNCKSIPDTFIKTQYPLIYSEYNHYKPVLLETSIDLFQPCVRHFIPNSNKCLSVVRPSSVSPVFYPQLTHITPPF